MLTCLSQQFRKLGLLIMENIRVYPRFVSLLIIEINEIKQRSFRRMLNKLGLHDTMKLI